MFHVSHGKWETAAPIRTFVPYDDGRSILASYAARRSASPSRQIHQGVFEVLLRRWWSSALGSWLMNNRRLQIDYERCLEVTEGFIWAAHVRLLRWLTCPDNIQRAA